MVTQLYCSDWLNFEARLGPVSPASRHDFPDFLVISPAKTATTWLSANLQQHGHVAIPPGKEVRYFDMKWRHHSIEWYCEWFKRKPEQLAGDVSPPYALLPSFAIKHIHSIKPDLKIILLLRDLPAQAWSHLKHTRVNGEANFAERAGRVRNLSFDDLFGNLVHDYTLSTSDYEGILRRWRAHFPREQFHVAFFEEAIRTPERYYAELFGFLGVAPQLSRNLARTRINRGDSSTPPATLIPWIEEIYGPRQRSLELYLKDAFGLTSPWPKIRKRADDRAPLTLPYRVAGRMIALQNGLFQDVHNLNSRNPPGSVLSGAPQRFVGDLMRMRDPDYFPAEAGLRERGISIEDRRLVFELDRLAEIELAKGTLPTLVGTIGDYNMIYFKDKFIGVPQSLGPIDLARYDLNDMPTSLVFNSRSELENAISQAISQELE